MVFDIKLSSETFIRKVTYCADGHNTEPPSLLTYITVEAQYSVIIIMFTVALNIFLNMGGRHTERIFARYQLVEVIPNSGARY